MDVMIAINNESIRSRRKNEQSIPVYRGIYDQGNQHIDSSSISSEQQGRLLACI